MVLLLTFFWLFLTVSSPNEVLVLPGDTYWFNCSLYIDEFGGMLSMNFGKLTLNGNVHWIVSKLSNKYLIRDKSYEERLLLNRTMCSIGIVDFQGDDFGTYILEVDFIRKQGKIFTIKTVPIGKKKLQIINAYYFLTEYK